MAVNLKRMNYAALSINLSIEDVRSLIKALRSAKPENTEDSAKNQLLAVELEFEIANQASLRIEASQKIRGISID
jgi:hypothetical protein